MSPVSPSQRQRGSNIAKIHERPLNKTRHVLRRLVYTVYRGLYVDHVIACGRPSRPRGCSYLLRGCFCGVVCCVRVLRRGLCVWGFRADHVQTVRTYFLPSEARWVVASIFRSTVSKSLNPYDTRYDTIFRYDIQHFSS